MEDELKGLRDTIGELTELSKIYNEIKEFSKLTEEESKLEQENSKLTQEHCELWKEKSNLPQEVWKLWNERSKLTEEEWKLWKENSKLEQENSKEIDKKCKEIDKKCNEIREKWKRIQETRNILRQKRKLIEEKRHVIEEKSKEVKELRKTLPKALFAINELKVLQLDFIDDQIKSTIKSSLEELKKMSKALFAVNELKVLQLDVDDQMLRLLEIGSIVRDSLDDVRLIVLEEMIRKRDKTVLSVYVPCSSPIVKVISTKKNIQESFMYKTKIRTVDKDKNQNILHDWNEPTLNGVLHESNVLEVLNLPDNCLDSVTMVVKITDVGHSTVRDYKVVFKSEEDWKMIPAVSQEGYVKFSPPPMKYFFVISTERWESHKVSAQGSVYISGDSKDVKVTFPPSSLSQECEIDIQATPPDTAKLSKCQDRNDRTDIVSVSQRLWVKLHGVPQFQKPIVATIPLPTVPSTEGEVDFYLVDWTKDDMVDIAKTELHMREIVCEFEVDPFSGKSLVALRRKRTNNNWMNDIHRFFLDKGGMAKECNILIFSDPSAVQTLWIQIVESKRKEEVLKSLSEKGMVPITNAESGTITIQYGQIIRIDALGSIRIPSHYQLEYRQIKFSQNEESNRLRFDVDIVDAKNRAVLEFRVETKQIHVCPFDAKKWLQHQNELQCVGTDSRLFRTVLDRRLLELVENLAFKTASIHMVQKGLFDDVTMSEIEGQKTEPMKIKELIKQLKKRDWDTYKKFKDCLVEIKQKFLKDMLEEEEAKLANEIGETNEAWGTDIVLSEPNLEALADRIPARCTTTLATCLGLSLDGLNKLIGAGHKDKKLTTEVLFLWRRKCNQDVNKMVSTLAEALRLLNLKHLASELLTASAQNRNLTFK